jgi:hypothetical protein
VLWSTFRAVFVEDKEELDSASNEQLRARFRKMRDGDRGEHLLPRGIRTGCFLVADRAVIENEATRTPYVPRYADDLKASVHMRPEDPVVYIRAVDPDFDVRAKAAEEKKEEGEKDEANDGNRVGTSGKGGACYYHQGEEGGEIARRDGQLLGRGDGRAASRV